jgi:peptide/nickel transport system substrate-binding protein
MKRLRFVLLIGLVLLAIMPMLAQDESTLRWGFPADSTTFNTVLQVEAVDSVLQSLVFPQLSRNNLVTGQPEPNLASWEISEDGLTYTFTIREDANWSDGTPITAQDAVFTINALTSENVETFRAITGLSAINVIDEKTFEIVLEQATCGLLSELSFGIMPAHKFAEDYSDFAISELNLGPDISGGPYVFVERSTDEFLRFAANDTYFDGRPNIDQIVIQVIPDNDVRTQAIQSGDIDYTNVTAEQAELLAGNPDVEVISYPINGWYMTMFNLADPANMMPARDEAGNPVEQAPHPILSDVRVRQALIMGWNHEDALFLAGESALPLPGPVTPALPDAFNSDLAPYAYDPDAAAALLDEAGWVDSDGDGIRDKDGVPLELDLIYLAANENDATLMADYWRDLGVEATLVTGEQGAMIGDRLAPQNFDMFVIGISWNQPTADVMLNFLYSSANDPGTNFASFVDEEFDSLLGELATGSCDPMARQPIYHRLQEIAYEQAIADYLYTQVAYVAKTPRLTNIEFTTWGTTPINQWELAGE